MSLTNSYNNNSHNLLLSHDDRSSTFMLKENQEKLRNLNQLLHKIKDEIISINTNNNKNLCKISDPNLWELDINETDILFKKLMIEWFALSTNIRNELWEYRNHPMKSIASRDILFSDTSPHHRIQSEHNLLSRTPPSLLYEYVKKK